MDDSSSNWKSGAVLAKYVFLSLFTADLPPQVVV
jgi:hypothetical protein